MLERDITAEVWIPLTQGKVTVIDFDDFEKVRGLKWFAHKDGRTFYASRHSSLKLGPRRSLTLHREILKPGDGMEVDHINGDGLDNRRSNLRIVTRFQNSLNQKPRANKTSKYRGVCLIKGASPKWKASISLSNVSTYLGYFKVEEDAARAYDAAARVHFGEFAQLNFK